MNESPEYALVARHVRKAYLEGGEQLEILRDVNLVVRRGERLALTGVSGAGKSTLLHILGGLDKADRGEVFVAGQALHKLSLDAGAALRNRYLGFVYQFHHLLPEFSAAENVAMPLLIGGVSRSAARERATGLLDRIGLHGRLGHRPGQLSGGERQRVAIARALVTRPVCVLMDEPTGNLDKGTAQRVHELLLDLNSELHISLVVVTHNHDLARVMGRTELLQDGVLKPVAIDHA